MSKPEEKKTSEKSLDWGKIPPTVRQDKFKIRDYGQLLSCLLFLWVGSVCGEFGGGSGNRFQRIYADLTP